MRVTAPLLLALILVAGPTTASEISGPARMIHGDLIELAGEHVRIAGIDAPERSQPYGAEAALRMEELVSGRDFEILDYKLDPAGQVIAKVWVDGRDIGLAMVADGAAWWYRHPLHKQTPEDRALYKAAEDQARARRLGLWAVGAPVPPWTWRRR